MNRFEITLQDVFWALRKYLVWIIVVTVIFTVGAWAYSTFFITPIYSTNISVCVFSNQRGSTSGVTSGELAADAGIANTYELLLTSQPVMDAVSERLGGKIPPAALRGMITPDVQNGTQVIKVIIRGTDPQLIADVGNALAEVAPTCLNELARGGEMIAVDHATVPSVPVSPNIPSNTTVGGVLGLLISCAVVIMVALLDTTVWREGDLERTFGIPVLGSVPPIGGAAASSSKRKHKHKHKHEHSHESKE